MGSLKNFVFISSFVVVLLSTSIDCNENDTNGYYVLHFKRHYKFCFPNCASKTLPLSPWYINDFKFQLFSNENPCNNRTSDVDEGKISSMRDEITKKWFQNDTKWSINSIWKNSGSCSLRIPELNDELKYFRKALELSDKYDINKIKNKYKIPDNSSLIPAVEKELKGKKPKRKIEIFYDEDTQAVNVILSDIFIFLDKSFNPIDSDDVPNDEISKTS